MKRALLVFPLLGALIAPSIVSAQSVAVLGIRSLEGDDEFARNLTGALTHAASQVDGWDVSDREVTLSQMALVHGCDDPNPTCLHEIADSLSVQRLIYGDVARTSSGDDFQFSVNLHHFDNETGQIEHSIADTISSIRQDIDDLRDPSRRWMAGLSGVPRAGTLVVRVNVPGAEVVVDGDPVGVVDANGVLTVENVEAGSRQVRVTAAEHTAFTSSVSVEPYAEATLEGELQMATTGGGGFPVNTVVGAALLVAGAAFAGVAIYSAARVDAINNDSVWVMTRATSMRDNICELRGPQTALCDEGGTLEVLQFVFMGLAAAAGGVGLYFILSPDDEEASEQATLELLPSAGTNYGMLQARVRF